MYHIRQSQSNILYSDGIPNYQKQNSIFAVLLYSVSYIFTFQKRCLRFIRTKPFFVIIKCLCFRLIWLLPMHAFVRLVLRVKVKVFSRIAIKNEIASYIKA